MQLNIPYAQISLLFLFDPYITLNCPSDSVKWWSPSSRCMKYMYIKKCFSLLLKLFLQISCEIFTCVLFIQRVSIKNEPS